MTLVEAIVSNLILCGAVVTLGALTTKSISEIRLNGQYETASSLANRQLTMIDYIGISRFLEMGRLDGEFEYASQKFIWQAQAEELEIGNLYVVCVRVSWAYRNQVHNVTVYTRLNSASSSITEVLGIPGTGER